MSKTKGARSVFSRLKSEGRISPSDQHRHQRQQLQQQQQQQQQQPTEAFADFATIIPERSNLSNGVCIGMSSIPRKVREVS
jgi:membrane peptidoglycan carboxypeptidase